MPTAGKLKHQFGLSTAIALVVGQVIGVGIFLTPATMAKSLGSPFLLLAVWLAIGAATLCGALSYGELAARFPEAGGSYVYLREAYGSGTAFLYGWMVLLVLDPGLTAAFAVGMTGYVEYFTPLSEAGKKIVPLAAVWTLALLNIAGARLGAGLLQVLTVLKIAALLFLVVWGFGAGLGDWNNFTPFFERRSGSESLVGALAIGSVGAFFAFAGWWEASRIAGEIKNPNRNLPRALTLGVLLIWLLYVLTSAVFLYLVPLGAVAGGETFAAQAGEALFGRAGGAVFAAVVIVSVLGTVAAYLMASPRVYLAMAADGLFPAWIARLHPRFQTPHRATLVQVLLASVLILTGTFETIISYFFFAVVFFIALTVAGLFIIRRRQPDFAGYRAVLFPLTPLAFIALAAAVMLMIAARNPVETAVGAGIVLLGLPIYQLFFRGKLAHVEV